MVEWCKRIFENRLVWTHVISVIKAKIGQESKPFTVKNGELYKMGQDNRLRRCSRIIEAQMVMKESHEGPSGGHSAIEIMWRTILDARY